MEKDLKEYWKSLPLDVQALYGWEYVNTIIQGARLNGMAGAPTTAACVDSMEHVSEEQISGSWRSGEFL